MSATETLVVFLAIYGLLSLAQDQYAMWQSLLAMRRHSTPREPDPEPGPRVTPHKLMIDGWRQEREDIEAAMEETRDVMIEVRRTEKIRGIRLNELKTELHDNLQTLGRDLRDLNAAIAEDERANAQ